jgi:hypothetical protein
VQSLKLDDLDGAGWITLPVGESMKKLNTHEMYRLAQIVGRVSELEYQDGMKLQTVFFPVARLDLFLRKHLQEEMFSPSMKRSAAAITRAIYNLQEKDVMDADANQEVQSWQLSTLTQTIKEFEIVIANELPGLATYIVSSKGIYSTNELIVNAEEHIPESLRPLLPLQALKDFNEAGKCLAFEVATASAFHMFRAVESVMEEYFKIVLSGGKSFEDVGASRNWGAYIKAMNDAGANSKITVLLNHIREEYRNPVTHPNETLDIEQAFGLFGVSASAITQMLRAIAEKKKSQSINLPATSAGLRGVFAGLAAIAKPEPTKDGDI